MRQVTDKLLCCCLIVITSKLLFDRRVDERRICWVVEGARHVVGLELEKQRKISLFWMSNKLIGGVPSFMELYMDYGDEYEDISKIILRKDLFAILDVRVQFGLPTN